MNMEFHYYITYILAKEAGFQNDDAYIIAYSSQYVDDNYYHYFVNSAGGNNFISDISQTMDITKPSAKRQKIYSLFHFIPGDPDSPTARRKDNRKHLLNTTPDNENAREIFNKSLATKDPYRIGIATHSYADTWAHQNFIGIKDNFNALARWNIIPNIGHADARCKPDIVNNRWRDRRLIKDNEHIDNNKRFLQAAEKIFLSYCRYHNSNITNAVCDQRWNVLKEKLKDAMNESYLLSSNKRAREKAYKKLCPGIPEYDKKRWRHEAVEKFETEFDIFDRYWAKEDFQQLAWYKFQNAVKEHSQLSLSVLKHVLAKAKVA